MMLENVLISLLYMKLSSSLSTTVHACLLCHRLINQKPKCYFWALHSVPLTHVSVWCTAALSYSLRPGNMTVVSPALFFFAQDCFAIWGLLCFHTDFLIMYSSSVKNATDNLTGIALKLCIGSMVILTILILPIQEHGICFYVSVSSSISSNSVL